MQLNDYQHIDELMERFFNGETSNEEEQELYHFFAREDLPERLKAYRPMFGFFEKGIAAEEQKAANPTVKTSFFRNKWFYSAMAVAAALLFVLFLNKGSFSHDDDFNPYEGSHIIRNGVKTVIPENVARNMEQIVLQAERREVEKERLALNTVRQKVEETEKMEEKANQYLNDKK